MFDRTSPDPTSVGRRSRGRAQRRRPTRALAGAAVGVCLLAAACGSDGEEGATSTSADATTTLIDETASGESAERTVVSNDVGDEAVSDEDAAGEEVTTTTVEAPSTTTAAGEAPEGEPLDFGPSAGSGLAIVGVAFDDTLNFRAAPSPDAEMLESIAPLSDDLDMSALGEAWAAPSGVWWKVNVAGTEAWANQAFLGGLGATENRFDEVASELGVLMFEDVESAALAVAETRASEDPLSRIVFAGEPLAFETGGFAVVDVLDLGDDSVKGERIRIDVEIVFDEASGEEGAQDVAFVVLTDVQITPICGRGTSGGLCT